MATVPLRSPHQSAELGSRPSSRGIPGCFQIFDLLRIQSSDPGTGGIDGHGVIAKNKDSRRLRLALDGAIAFHADDSVNDGEMSAHRAVDIDNALVDSMPVKEILWPAVLHSRHQPKQILHRERHPGPMMGLKLGH